MNLRPYQLKVIDTIKDTFKSNDRQYVVMPTGSGKTITFLQFAKANYKDILIIVPSKELLNQVYDSALLFYDRREISRKGSHFYEPIKSVHICIIHSLRGDYLNKVTNHNFDLVIIDEAHHSQSKMYKNLIHMTVDHNKKTKFLGCTATPDRTDGQVLDDILFTRSISLEIPNLINQGYLSDIEGYCVKTKIDLSYVDDHNGDFSLRQIYKKLCVESRNDMILDISKNEMKNRKCIIFCINIEHSQIISKLLNENGLESMHIDGTNTIKQRASTLKAFREGEIQFLTNCQLLSEGFDEPSIDGIILARPTRSRSLFLQMLGRGLRIHPGKKNCKVIDIVDNHKALANFNYVYVTEDSLLLPIEKFKDIKEIKRHVEQEELRIGKINLEKTELISFDSLPYMKCGITDSMRYYLDNLNTPYLDELSFEEGSFLIWYNKLKEKYYGMYNKEKA